MARDLPVITHDLPGKTQLWGKTGVYPNPWFTRDLAMIYPCKPVKNFMGLELQNAYVFFGNFGQKTMFRMVTTRHW
jgi:hypothetical protein